MENVWEYPRPPALVPCERHVRVEVDGADGPVVVAESDAALRVLETSHPPTIYVPPGDISAGLLQPSAARGTWCEWKGAAVYWDAVLPGGRLQAIGWSYPDPTSGFEALRDHVCFYPGRVRAWLDEEPVKAQEGDFYGGWITDDLVGPFKGGPGTLLW